MSSAELRQKLSKQIFGQDPALEAIQKAYRIYRTGMSRSGHPIANMLFLGPTGTGKTRTVEATAEALLGTKWGEPPVLKVDCGEFQHSHEISKLIGSPPGYLGHRETHPYLSQEMLNQHHTPDVKISFVLFDEIEKASDALWNLLLGIMDKGILTLGDNRKVDFSKAFVFMTSNLGAREMAAAQKPMGFGGMIPQPKEDLSKRFSEIADAAARKRFTPEFFERLDSVVTFKPLDQGTILKIVDHEIELLSDRIFFDTESRLEAQSPQEAVQFSDTAREKLYELCLDSKHGGARNLQRIMTTQIVDLIAEQIEELMLTPNTPASHIEVFYHPENGFSVETEKKQQGNFFTETLGP